MTNRTGGYFPSGLEDPLAGMDCENASGGVYPFGLISALKPTAWNTTKTIRDYVYQDCKVVDWKQSEHTVIHHYETFHGLQTLMALGMDREVITDFYSYLVHTGRTQTGFEYDIGTWRDLNFHNNYPPHGWCAARFNECLRNILVREDMEAPVLQLASTLSPLCLEPGRTVRVKKAPTHFGMVSDTLTTTGEGAHVNFDAEWPKPPKNLKFHLPWFLDLGSAMVDGKSVAAKNRIIDLPADAHDLTLKCTHNSNPPLSYQNGVENYVDRYWKIQHDESVPGFDRRWMFAD